MIHGDIKPENMILDKKFNLKIADFAGAHGTPGYTPPENLTDVNSDIWACAVSLFIMVVK